MPVCKRAHINTKMFPALPLKFNDAGDWKWGEKNKTLEEEESIWKGSEKINHNVVVSHEIDENIKMNISNTHKKEWQKTTQSFHPFNPTNLYFRNVARFQNVLFHRFSSVCSVCVLVGEAKAHAKRVAGYIFGISSVNGILFNVSSNDVYEICLWFIWENFSRRCSVSLRSEPIFSAFKTHFQGKYHSWQRKTNLKTHIMESHNPKQDHFKTSFFFRLVRKQTKSRQVIKRYSLCDGLP